MMIYVILTIATCYHGYHGTNQVVTDASLYMDVLEKQRIMGWFCAKEMDLKDPHIFACVAAQW